jgi:glycosyltransferase involved in cell wall biosynthesis
MSKFFLVFFCCISLFASNKILVGSPIRQKPAILKEFLDSFRRLDKKDISLHYLFIDDNDVEESRVLLEAFQHEVGPNCRILRADVASPVYVCNEVTHYWNDDLVWKVAGFKDKIIEVARDEEFDYLFFIDSDIVLHPMTLHQLVSANKEIISNIFWTTWVPGGPNLPQVWLTDVYNLYELKSSQEKITQEEALRRQNEFIGKLKKPGVYEVGGLGACTLISRQALQKGISFRKIKNLTFWGEDRHFCVRAAALGIPLFVETTYPAYHIYREGNLAGVPGFVKSCTSPRITLSMIMKNEASHYLRPMLMAAREYITDAVIIDDASTDDSVEVAKEVLAGIPLHIVQNKESKFSNEVVLRKQQWEETIKTNPEWIVFLDADQIFEPRFKDQVKKMVQDQEADLFCFRLYDFWDDHHYRDDQYWCAHKVYRPFLVRYKPGIEYQWKNTPQHCGSFPATVLQFPAKYSDLRLKHYGWATKEDRLAKYNRYMKLDPGAKYGWKEQYDSILDEHPHLITWIDTYP